MRHSQERRFQRDNEFYGARDERDDEYNEDRFSSQRNRYERSEERFDPYYEGSSERRHPRGETWREHEAFRERREPRYFSQESDRELDRYDSPYGRENEYERSRRFGERRGPQGGGRSYGPSDDSQSWYGSERRGESHHGSESPYEHRGYGHRAAALDPRRYHGGMNHPGTESRNFAGEAKTYRGKGPRGYSRSDERIREDVCERLSDDDSLDASDIEVNVKSQVVTLSGNVESKNAKRCAEDLAEKVSGVKDVTNQLKVKSSEERATEIGSIDREQKRAS